ncbi:MAG: hypothetical protein E6J69_09300 [Deltaproteobacteria bacterium]|nr:MAG: hypothetical protein E6J79_07175 [Deltaproteobacteria bacterium]TMA59626.1 MAG: hypothetical protein E6J75_02725 [Deltaproteobacteria bacterium]TMA67533.1 MAG: hypothetical protein E6J69_09300 [Deltaproteobacteria bacterium]
MSGDTHEGLRSSVAHQHDIRGRDDALAARLAGLERTNQELQERVRRYERERVEIKLRLGRLLARMGIDLP